MQRIYTYILFYFFFYMLYISYAYIYYIKEPQVLKFHVYYVYILCIYIMLYILCIYLYIVLEILEKSYYFYAVLEECLNKTIRRA